MADSSKINNHDFQTPKPVCEYMASFVEEDFVNVLEPTAGSGNLVDSLRDRANVFAPDDFYSMEGGVYDYVVMNPPFTPMKTGYDILFKCMEMTSTIVALMPYLTLINSEKRMKSIFEYGLVSITHLPRKTFRGSRVQTCILHMDRFHDTDRDGAFFKRLPSEVEEEI